MERFGGRPFNKTNLIGKGSLNEKDIGIGKGKGRRASLSGFDTTYIIILVFCLLFLCFNILTFISMKRTKRLPYACKLLTCLMCIYDILFITFLPLGLFINEFEAGSIPRSILLALIRISHVVPWLTVTLTSLERTVCLYFPYIYAVHSTKRVINITVASILVCFALFKTFIRYVILPLADNQRVTFRDSKTSGIQLNMFILGSCLILNVICYLLIFRVVRQQVKRVKAVTKNQPTNASASYPSTKSVCVILGVFVALHAPLFMMYVLKEIFNKAVFDARSWSFILSITMCGIYPFLYVWRFKECRYQTLCIISRAFRIRAFGSRMDSMRMEVYNIITKNQPPTMT